MIPLFLSCFPLADKTGHFLLHLNISFLLEAPLKPWRCSTWGWSIINESFFFPASSPSLQCFVVPHQNATCCVWKEGFKGLWIFSARYQHDVFSLGLNAARYLDMRSQKEMLTIRVFIH